MGTVGCDRFAIVALIPPPLDGAVSLTYIDSVNADSEEDMKNRVNAVAEINRRTRELRQFFEDVEALSPRLTLEELDEVHGKMTLLRGQGIFWLAESNPQRFAYDLRNFQSWLLEFLGDRNPQNKA